MKIHQETMHRTLMFQLKVIYDLSVYCTKVILIVGSYLTKFVLPVEIGLCHTATYCYVLNVYGYNFMQTKFCCKNNYKLT